MKIKSRNWVVAGQFYKLRDISNQQDLLQPAIYEMQQNPNTGEIFLEKTRDKFEFPFKIYGHEKRFIDRTIKAYNNTVGNLGVLMNGIKGTGKSITAKQICNEMGLPVIVVTNPFGGIIDFINSIEQDVVIFLDEYEKMYDEDDGAILTLMDGALNNEYRKTFILTTNKLNVNDNLLQRPSRVRYLKLFGNLDTDVIIEIVNDLLENKEFTDEVVLFLSKMKIITIDLVKSVINEVNIFDELPDKFKDIFNVKLSDPVYDVIYQDSPDKPIVHEYYQKIPNYPFEEHNIGNYVSVGGKNIGELESFDAESGSFVVEKRVYDITSGNWTRKMVLYQVEPSNGGNEQFSNYYNNK